jgi:hypothetical protein
VFPHTLALLNRSFVATIYRLPDSVRLSLHFVPTANFAESGLQHPACCPLPAGTCLVYKTPCDKVLEPYATRRTTRPLSCQRNLYSRLKDSPSPKSSKPAGNVGRMSYNHTNLSILEGDGEVGQVYAVYGRCRYLGGKTVSGRSAAVLFNPLRGDFPGSLYPQRERMAAGPDVHYGLRERTLCRN